MIIIKKRLRNFIFFQMDVKIIEPIRNYLKEFNSTEEFNAFYSMHKDEMDALTTHKLNKMYHVNGYRITKIKGELMLKRWENKRDEEEHLKQEISQASTRATEVNDYVRNELAKKVDDLSSFRQEMQIIAQNQSKYNQDVNQLKQELKQELTKNSQDIARLTISQQTQTHHLQDQIDDLLLDIKKIKVSINDIIDFLNGRK